MEVKSFFPFFFFYKVFFFPFSNVYKVEKHLPIEILRKQKSDCEKKKKGNKNLKTYSKKIAPLIRHMLVNQLDDDNMCQKF